MWSVSSPSAVEEVAEQPRLRDGDGSRRRDRDGPAAHPPVSAKTIQESLDMQHLFSNLYLLLCTIFYVLNSLYFYLLYSIY